MRGTAGTGGSWQFQVIKFDRDGPGILGYYLDTVALLASLCPLVPAVQDRSGHWTRSDDPVLNTLASGLRSPLFEQHELVSQLVRAREGVGEGWIIYSDDIGWHVATVPNVNAGSGPNSAVVWTDTYGVQRKTDAGRAHKSWIPDPWEPWMPTSPVRRAIPNLRRIHSAVRSQTRAADSRLVMNGMMAFDPGGEGALRPFATGEGDAPGADEVVQDYMEYAQRAFNSDDTVAAVVPFPYIGKKAEHVQVGRGIDEQVIKMEDKAIEAFARDVNFPAQLLTTGPGTANHWNEWILQEIQQKMGLAPKLNPVCWDFTTIYLRPVVAQLRNKVGSWDVDPNRVRLEPDYSFLTSKPDKTGKAIEAYRIGAITREELVEELGFAEVMPLPAGISEYEHWQLASGGKGFPFIEVGADGRVVLPEPLPPVTDDLPVVDDAGVIDEPGDEMPPPLDAGSPALPAGDAGAAEVVEEPPSPAAPVAALGIEPIDPAPYERTLEQLAAIDLTLSTSLHTLSTAAGTAALSAVARAVIRAHPPRSNARAVLRDLPPEEVWAAAAQDIREKVDVDAVIAEAVEPFQAQAEELLTAAAEDIAATTGDDGILMELFVALAVAALVSGIVHIVAGWVVSPARLAMDAVERAGKPRLLRIPIGVIREAMMIAGGGSTGPDGRLVKGGGGVPTPRNGGPWMGGTGMATGHAVASSLPTLADYGLALRWLHGVTRTPAVPFKPHLELNGQVFASLADIPDGHLPLSHPNCSCLLALTIRQPASTPDLEFV